MDKIEESRLRIALNDILLGYSVIKVKREIIYAKHFDNFDSAIIEAKYVESYQKALDKKLQTAQQKIESALIDKSWAKEKEEAFLNLPTTIQTLKLSKSKTLLKKEKQRFTKEIVSKEKELEDMVKERNSVIGYCVETFATKRMNEFFVYYTFRKENLKDFYFDINEFDELEHEDLDGFIKLHNEYADKFEINKVKKIAISHFFMSLIFIAGEDVFGFYGKPVINLTHRQIELYSLGRYYKDIMQRANGTIPKNIEDDPEKLVEFIENKKNIEEFNKNQNKQTSDGVALVGATKEDIDEMGLAMEAGATSLEAEATKQGKRSLNFEDLIKLHGA